MRVPATVVVLGTGSFARALVTELVSEHHDDDLHLAIVGRTTRAVDETVDLARQHAAPYASLTVEPITVGLALDVDLTAIIHALQPRLVIVCASLHSPYTADQNGDRWTDILRSTAFGFTALLQAPLAVRAAQAIDRSGRDSRLINACYPDFVNPLLTALGLPVLCGLGNAATLAAGLTAQVDPDGWDPVRVLAHHRHLKQELAAADDARVWHPRADPSRITAALRTVRGLPRRELNDLGAAAGGRLVAALIRGEATRTSLPGPAGLPGGYPVVINSDECRLDLPAAMGFQEAVSWNQGHAHAEGAQVRSDGTVHFTGSAALALAELGVTTDDTLDATDWETTARRLLQARERLTPAGRTTS